MPSPFMNVAVARAVSRMPGLRALPLARLVIMAEVAMLAKDHFERLTPPERRRLVVLVTEAKGRPKNLSDRDRSEFEALVAKLEPKLFASSAAERFSPVPPRRPRS
jgi:hypothetical protein